MPEVATYTLLTFGVAREITGTSSLILELPAPLTLGELRQNLEERFPDFLKLKNYFIAKNQEYVRDEAVLFTPEDEIAIIPPVSGG
jgi:molybdopterin converting factor small subunit